MDALLLHAVIAEARPRLVGTEVREVFGADLHGLWLRLAGPQGDESLLVTSDPALPRLCRGTPRPPRPPLLSPLAGVARRLLPGRELRALSQRGLDRTVTLELSGPPSIRLVAELFGRHPNLLLLEESGVVLEAARRAGGAAQRGPEIGQPYAPPLPPGRPDPRLLSEAALAGLLAPVLAAGFSPAVALGVAFTGITEIWAQEIAARAASTGAEALARSLLALLDRIAAGPWDPQLVLDASGRPVAASPIRLASVDSAQDPCPTLGDAVERLARSRLEADRQADRRSTLRHLLRRLDTRLDSRKAKLVQESDEFGRADLYQRMGEALIRNQGSVPRGAAEAVLPDLTDGSGEPLRIPLDPTLSPSANAERLFRSARRGRRGRLRVEARLHETEAELAQVRAWTHRLGDAAGESDLATLQTEMEKSRLLRASDLASLGATPPVGPHRPARPRPPGRGPGPGSGLAPRRFRSSDGIPILVGKGPEGNDHLTLHLSRSDDLWLHVQGRSGSHVVVRSAKREGGLPRRTLIQAAQLAAYYSQARDDGKVEVAYTLRKYVRKPKKAKPGLVTISQEKTILVSPDKGLVAKLADADEGE